MHGQPMFYNTIAYFCCQSVMSVSHYFVPVLKGECACETIGSNNYCYFPLQLLEIDAVVMSGKINFEEPRPLPNFEYGD